MNKKKSKFLRTYDRFFIFYFQNTFFSPFIYSWPLTVIDISEVGKHYELDIYLTKGYQHQYLSKIKLSQ